MNVPPPQLVNDFNVGVTSSCRQRAGEDIQTKQQELTRHFQSLDQFNTAREQVEQSIAQYQIAINELQCTRNGTLQGPQQMTEYKDQVDHLKNNLALINNNLCALSQKVLSALTDYVKLCEGLIINWTKEELISWKQQQKVAQYGGPDALPSLTTLAQRYYVMTDYVFTAWKWLQRAGPILRKLPNTQRMDAVHSKLFSLFYQLMNTSFLVVHQPPMIAKNRITVRVGMLGAIDKFGFESQRTVAQCRVISEETANDLKRNPEKIESANIQTCGTMDTNKIKEKDIERLSKENVLGFEFKNIKVKVDSRKTSAKDGEAIKRKYYLLFSCTITIGDQQYKIFTLSLPFMVSVHGSQDKDLWAKAFWDMAFSDGLFDIPMKGRNEVRWSELSVALNHVFSCILYANTERKINEPQTQADRKLTDNDLAYIKTRLYNGQVPLENDPVITWAKFYNENLYHMSLKTRQLNFSLWEWFFRIADMLQEKSGHEIRVKALWNLRLLEGFLSKVDAEKILLTCKDPTFLLRFSDNNLNSVSVVVLKDAYDVKEPEKIREIDHLAPFRYKEEITEKFSLPQCVIRCQELEYVKYVYPNIPKKAIEDQIPQSKQQTSSTPQKIGYRNVTIKFINEGDSTQRKSSDSNASTPLVNTVGSPGLAYSPQPVNSPISPYSPQQYFKPKFPTQQQFAPQNGPFPNDYLMDQQNLNNAFFNGQDPDVAMSDDDIIEIIYQDLRRHEDYLDTTWPDNPDIQL